MPAPVAVDGVTASCDDLVRVTDAVFTGRPGAWLDAGVTRPRFPPLPPERLVLAADLAIRFTLALMPFSAIAWTLATR